MNTQAMMTTMITIITIFV